MKKRAFSLCIRCGKRRGDHSANSTSCPVGRKTTIGFSQYSTRDTFQSETFSIVKQAYISNHRNWMDVSYAMRIHGYDPMKMTLVMHAFEKFLLPAYNQFFVHNECGVALVTAINDQGLALWYFYEYKKPFKNGDYCSGDREGVIINAVVGSFIGNKDATPRTFLIQEPPTFWT